MRRFSALATREAEYLAQRQKHPRSAEQVRLMVNKTPDIGYVFQEAASPCVESFGAGEDIVQAGDPVFGVATPYPNKLALEFAVDNNNNAKPVATTLFDTATTSFAFLGHALFTDHRIASSGGFLGKNPAASPRYVAQVANNGNLTWQTKDTLGAAVTATLPFDTDGIDTWFWMGINKTTDLIYLATRQGSISASIAGQGTLTNASVFRLGNQTGLSTGFKLLALYQFSGANAEGETGPDIIARAARYMGG